MTSLETYAGLLRNYIDNPNMVLEPIIDLCIEDEDNVREQIWKHIKASRDSVKPCRNEWYEEIYSGSKIQGLFSCPNATEIKTHGFAREMKICTNCKAKASSYYKLADELIPSQFEFYSADINNLEYQAFNAALLSIWDMGENEKDHWIGYAVDYVPDDDLQRLYTDFTE
jgi:hypothetical protein